MASLIQKKDRWSLQFALKPRSERTTLALGTMTEAQALGCKERVEALIEAIRSDAPPDPSTRKWVRGLDDHFHAKLAKAGLVVPRVKPDEGPSVPTLASFLDRYISSRTDVKPATAIVYGHTRRCLVEFFGATRPLDRITLGESEDFRRWLADDQKLADNTVRRRCGIAKQFFRAAIRRRLIVENPFGDMASCSIRENREREYFITRDEASKVLDACPDCEWRLLFAMSRFAGMRCPSEHLTLRWSDVDWERSRITVRSLKTEHHEGKDCRVIPIFPELRPCLEAAWEQAEEGATYVITRYRGGDVNLRTQLEKIIRRAGLKPWPKLWHNLRATRETKLAETYPLHVVCAWIGNSQLIARKHYLQVTDEHFRLATTAPEAPAALQKSLHQSGGNPCKPMQDHFGPVDKTLSVALGCIESQNLASYASPIGMGDEGLEPPTFSV